MVRASHLLLLPALYPHLRLDADESRRRYAIMLQQRYSIASAKGVRASSIRLSRLSAAGPAHQQAPYHQPPHQHMHMQAPSGIAGGGHTPSAPGGAVGGYPTGYTHAHPPAGNNGSGGVGGVASGGIGGGASHGGSAGGGWGCGGGVPLGSNYGGNRRSLGNWSTATSIDPNARGSIIPEGETIPAFSLEGDPLSFRRFNHRVRHSHCVHSSQ